MASEKDMVQSGATEQGPNVGGRLLRAITDRQPKDSYQPNGLPPVDEKRHTPEIIASLQKRAMEID
jgi:hypothetical protein